MKTKHYYVFEKEVQQKFANDTLDEKNWDILRMDEKEGPFSLEKTVESYEANCVRSVSYELAAAKIKEILEKNNLPAAKMISLGVGKGILEWHLKKMMPQMCVECTDFTEEAIEQLQKVFCSLDKAYVFDIVNGDYRSLDTGALFVMYRISTEFDSESWQGIFEKMYQAGIQNIVFVPTGVENFKSIMREKIHHWKNVLRGRKDICCGWIYSEDEFEKMFSAKGRQRYRIVDRTKFEDTAVWLLRRNADGS